MRDAMTARHSAAVARYSREVARDARAVDEREQDLIHTAALLHDIGKFIFPDSILLRRPQADRRGVGDRQAPSGAGREARPAHRGLRPRRRHRPQPPRALRRQRLLQRARRRADPARLAHHRRRRHLRRDDRRATPTAARSAREAALAELRRVAGSQLDPMVVETFVEMIERTASPSATPTRPTSSRELAFERRVADYARPQVIAA